MIDINTKPTYTASLQLACGLTAVASVVSGRALLDTQDATGTPRTAALTEWEVNEIASMLRAVQRALMQEGR